MCFPAAETPLYIDAAVSRLVSVQLGSVQLGSVQFGPRAPRGRALHGAFGNGAGYDKSVLLGREGELAGARLAGPPPSLPESESLTDCSPCVG